MKQCRTCQYWDAVSGTSWGFCDNPKLHDATGSKSDPLSDELLVADFLGAGLRTGKNFGCIHHLNQDEI